MTNRVGVLGPVQITMADRSAVDTGGKRQRRLLAALAVNAGDVVSVDTLVDIVFEGSPSDAAEKTLQSYVSRLRRALDGDTRSAGTAIERVEPGYVMRLGDSSLDAAEFVAGVTTARNLARDGDHAGAVRGFDQALRLWRGTPYAEFADEPWAMAEAQRLLEVRAGAIEDRADSQLALGGHADVVADLERFTLEEPTRERPRAQLMLALYRSGRQAEALRSYHDYHELLRDEMGLDPSPALRELEASVLARDPSLELGAVGGETLRGYRLFEEIGRGAFSVVRRGTQPAVGRDVAVKAIRAELANDPDFVRRFETEAHMVANLEHPHIVPLYDFWREPDGAYLVMRWLRGGTLEDRLADGPLDLATTATLVRHIGEALEAAHRQGIVHRDIKPANVFCDDDGNFFLGDFGIAIGDATAPDAMIHATTAPAYASPELLERQPVGPAADIYSLGVTVFEALTGARPFADAASDVEITHRQIHEPLAPISSIRAGIPASIDAVVGRATAKSVMGRYASAQEFASAFAAAVAPERSRSVAPTVPAAEPGPNPYKGLRAFHEADASDFFGRTALVDEMLDVLRCDGPSGRLLTVVGPSGSGKSSLVRAGLVPSLREGAVDDSADWFVATVMPGASPFAELEAALLRIAVNPPPRLIEQLTDGPDGIAGVVKRILPGEDTELLLVLDQAEELFTLTADADESAAFLAALLAAVDDPHSRLRVVATIRADFYDRPLADPRVADRVKASTIIVTPMASDQLAEAIALPARRAGAVFEDGLVARITADVAEQPGALPLLQYTLAELYDRGQGRLTHQLYEDLGGIAGTLAGRAETIYDSLTTAGQEGTRLLFSRLVTVGDETEDTRRRVLTSELGTSPAVTEAISAYGTSRLLTFDRDVDTREPTVEVAHEALIREWPRFHEWIDDDRDGLRIHRHLSASAVSWAAKNEDVAELYRGSRLDGALGWADTRTDQLNDLERRFLDTSRDHRDQEVQRARRQTRRLRRSLTAVAAVAVVAMIAGLLAFREQRRAEDALRHRATAEAEASQVEEAARELATDLDVRRLVDVTEGVTDQSLAILLAIETDRLRPGSPQAMSALVHAYLKGLGRIDAVDGLTWIEPDGSSDRFFGFSEGELTVRNIADPNTPLETIPLDFSNMVPTLPALAPAGDRVALGTDDGVVIVDLRTRMFGPVTEGRGEPRGTGVSSLHWTSDDHLVLADDPLQVFHVDGLEPSLVATVPGVTVHTEGAPLFMAAHPSEGRLAVGNASAGVEVWSVAALTEGRVDVIEHHPLDEALWTPKWSADGSALLAARLLAPELWIITGPDDRELIDFAALGFRSVFSVNPLPNGTMLVAGAGRAAIVDQDGNIETEWAPSDNMLVSKVIDLGPQGLVVQRTTIPDGDPSRVEVWDRGGGIQSLTTVLPEFGDLDDGETVLLLPEDDVAAVMRPILGTQTQIHESQADEVWDLGGPIPRLVELEGNRDYGPLRLQRTTEGPVVVGMEDGETIVVHDARTGAVISEFGVDHPERFYNLSISHDGREVIVLNPGTGEVTLYDAATGTSRLDRRFNATSTWLIRDEARRRGIVSTVNSPSPMYDLDTLETIDAIEGDFVIPSESWRYLVTIDEFTSEIVVREAATGDAVRVQNPRNLLARLNESEEFVIGWDTRPDGGLQWFDRVSGAPIGPVVAGPVADLHFDGVAVTQVIDGRVHVWNTDPTSWFDGACEAAGRQLTLEEWQLYMPDGMEYDPVCTG